MASQQGQRFQIELSGVSIRYREYTAGGTAAWNYYPVSHIKAVEPVRQIGYGTRDSLTNQRKHRTVQDDLLHVTISLIDDTKPLSFDIQNVMNQAGWTANSAGLNQALSDINGWIETGLSAGGASSASTDNLIQDLIDQDTAYNTGVVTPFVATPGLPYVTSGNENSATVMVLAGTVSINGATLPAGSYTFNAGPNETIDSFTIAQGIGGSIIFLSTTK